MYFIDIISLILKIVNKILYNRVKYTTLITPYSIVFESSQFNLGALNYTQVYLIRLNKTQTYLNFFSLAQSYSNLFQFV